MRGVALAAREEFIADAVHIDHKDGRAYLHLQDCRGWVCERSRTDFSKFAVEPLNEEDGASKTSPKKKSNDSAKVIVVERDTATVAKAAPAKPPRSSSLDQETAVLRSDSDLWPKSVGAPRPITMDTRRALQRLWQYYGKKVQECTKDLLEIEAKIKAFGASQSKKLLETHAEALRKEQASVEKQWTASVEKAVAKLPPHATTSANTAVVHGHVAPVQVLGQPWHCATLRSDKDSDELYLGPFRPQADAAAEDLERMAQLCGKSPSKKIKSSSAGNEPAAKKLRTSSDAD
jgi:hypothetical protein